MFEHRRIQELNDFFVELNNRQGNIVYCYRITGYNEQIKEFIEQYYEKARLTGVIIEWEIPNPDAGNLSYYDEIMGREFQLNLEFISSGLKKWLPRMKEHARNQVAESFFDCLNRLQKSGKNENMLKNAYIKFMCWMYYKFERILSRLGENEIPKILYEGEISKYELMFLSILANAGCDVVLLQYKEDESYLALDWETLLFYKLELPQMTAFPENFDLNRLRTERANQLNKEKMYGKKPEVLNCTNAWIAGTGLEDIKRSIQSRGNDKKLFYNCLYRINGVEDKLTYLNELYQFQLEIKNSGRRLLIIENTIPQPTTEEIGAVKRGTYTNAEQMLLDLSGNIQYTANATLERVMAKAFIDIMLEVAGKPDMNINKLTGKAVYVICWLRRYQNELFSNWKMPDISCFIYLGGCKNSNEAIFLRFLARLPIDVLILNPNLNSKCCLEDTMLFEKQYTQSLVVNGYPRENKEIQMGTAAYQAERELDAIMYQDSGIYRNQQYGKAAAVTLQTMYEEIGILWDQELKYRPNFSIIDDVVNLPVIFAKVSGVKDAVLQPYWSGIKTLLTQDTMLIKDVPYILPNTANPVKAFAADFLKNGVILKSKIKTHACYQYGLIREEMQEHLLDKLQVLIDRKIIKGTFENGTEYTIIATVLNMQKEILRLIQRFDFTKKNPKIIYINTTEKVMPLEDSILMAYLNLVGFDIVFFVPTGYQTVEKYYNMKIMEEHQIGEYMYDVTVPDFETISLKAEGKKGLDHIFQRLFKRGE